MLEVASPCGTLESAGNDYFQQSPLIGDRVPLLVQLALVAHVVSGGAHAQHARAESVPPAPGVSCLGLLLLLEWV